MDYNHRLFALEQNIQRIDALISRVICESRIPSIERRVFLHGRVTVCMFTAQSAGL